MRHTLLGVASAALALACLQAPCARAEVLITKAEAELPTPAKFAATTRGLTRGPGIEQLSPSPNQRVTSPLSFKIKFVTRNNVEIDPASVKLTYLKSQPIDLTERIKPHISAAGIAMNQAEVPPGTHVLQLDVSDLQGRNGTAIIKLNVAGK